MLERKIVRLIIMSNISRRQFLKSAGVAALAVAALTGCKKLPDTDIPDVPGVTSVDLRVLFVDGKGNPVGNGVTGHYDTTVLKDAKKYDPKLIPADKLPENYELASEDEVDITNNGNMNIALVPLKLHKVVTSTRYAKVMFWNYQTGEKVAKQFKIAEDAKQITVKDITLPEGWVLAEGNEDWYSTLKQGTGADAGLDIAERECMCKNA